MKLLLSIILALLLIDGVALGIYFIKPEPVPIPFSYYEQVRQWEDMNIKIEPLANISNEEFSTMFVAELMREPLGISVNQLKEN